MLKEIRRLYVHVPFCMKKCSYCAFYSIPDASETLRREYLGKMKNDLSRAGESCGVLDSVFVGGGNPGSLDPSELETLFACVKESFDISDSAEISVECNPESASQEKISIIANFANRISLGVQSFSPEMRRRIGRHGDVELIQNAFDLAKSSGIRQISCDMISSIPGQDAEQWSDELRKALGLGIGHLSAYSLSYDEGAELCPGIEAPHDDIAEFEIWSKTREILSSAGFQRYEISNFSVPGSECKHNLGIWMGEPYLGIGPSASSFDGRTRWTERADMSLWLSGSPPELDEIPPTARAAELLVMGLRTSQGWNFKKFDALDLVPIACFKNNLQELQSEGLLLLESYSARCSENGFLHWNDLAERLLI